MYDWTCGFCEKMSRLADAVEAGMTAAVDELTGEDD